MRFTGEEGLTHNGGRRRIAVACQGGGSHYAHKKIGPEPCRRGSG